MKTNSHSTHSFLSLIEPLESRIAPAAVFHFTDVDGDSVTIKSSKGTNTDLMNAATIVAGQFQLLDLSSATFGGEFDGASISISAVHSALGGDGHVNVGYLKAVGRDLASVSIDGDLGRIDCGDGNLATPALKSLTASSMGALGKTTQAAPASLSSFINGPVGIVKIANDLVGVAIHVEPGSPVQVGAVRVGGSIDGAQILVTGKLGVLKVGGDLIGHAVNTGRVFVDALGSAAIGGSLRGDGDFSGNLFVNGDAGKIVVGGSIIGGDGQASGRVAVQKHASTILVGGSVLGGHGMFAGLVAGGRIDHAAIHGDLAGGTALGAGYFDSGIVGDLTIGGSVRGGVVSSTGVVQAGIVGKIRIGGDVTGPVLVSAGSVVESGAIFVKSADSIFIGGSLRAGVAAVPGDLVRSGVIHADRGIDSVLIKGSVVGSATNVAEISAEGTGLAPGKMALKSVTVVGSLNHARILAGYGKTGSTINEHVQIGSITVGNWIDSSAAAGVNRGNDLQFGTADDAAIGMGGDPAIVSRIASVVIKGYARGSLIGMEHSGIVAKQIGMVRIGDTAFGFTAAPNEVRSLGGLGNFIAREDV